MANRMADLVDLVDLKRSPAERKEDAKKASGTAPGRDPYSWGTRVTLGEEELEKLGLDKLPAAGSAGAGAFRGRVIATQVADSGTGTERRLELQLTHLALGAGDEDADDAPQQSAAEKLYGKGAGKAGAA